MKKQRDSDRSDGNMLEGDGLRKNSSCFSNIKIFLISECALMLAQGTVGAYLVSARQDSATRLLLWVSHTCVVRLWALCMWLFMLLFARFGLNNMQESSDRT